MPDSAFTVARITLITIAVLGIYLAHPELRRLPMTWCGTTARRPASCRGPRTALDVWTYRVDQGLAGSLRRTLAVRTNSFDREGVVSTRIM
jgi:hypothetical protein